MIGPIVCVVLALGAMVGVAQAQPIVINEILYHPGHAPLVAEDTAAEFIELHNPTDQAVDLSGWAFTRGIHLDIPAGTRIPAGGYLVLAADPNHLRALHPGLDAAVGPWTGRLSNIGETLELVDDQDRIVDTVDYADDGDWSQRSLGPLDHEHRGWRWSNGTDGGGASLELTTLSLSNTHGVLWQASDVPGGTPGRVNSRIAGDVAPVILDVSHTPLIPHPEQAITVRARIRDDVDADPDAVLCYRPDTTAYPGDATGPYLEPAPFVEIPMTALGGGEVQAEIPPQADGTVLEFYVRARDEAGHSRTWPAAAEVDGFDVQLTNALIRVDAAVDAATYWLPGAQPLFYLVLKRAELDELHDISDRDYHGDLFAAEPMSNAQMNGTVIAVDGTGARVFYRVGVRNRGNRSRARPPLSCRLSFPREAAWRGRAALNLNSQYTPLQIMGSAAFRLAGLAAAEATAVQVRLNGADPARDDLGLTRGSYAALEALNADWAAHQVPADPDGHLYRGTYYDDGVHSRTFADLDYKEARDQEPDPNDYRHNYPKKTHTQSQDWSDLFHLIDVLNNPGIPDAEFMATVGTALDPDRWARYFAADALVGNAEGGLGHHPATGDDYALYRGIADPRFWLVPHDLDTVLGLGSPHSDPHANLLVYGEVDGLERLVDDPAMQARYYGQLWRLSETVFEPTRFREAAEHLLGSWAPGSVVDGMVDFVSQRRDYVRGEVQDAGLVPVADAPGPVVAPAPPVGPLILDELLVTDANGRPGWVEIRNDGDQPSALAGATLAALGADPVTLPSRTVAAGERLVLSLESLGLSLDPAGDRLQLRDAGDTLLDTLRYGPQIAGLSLGRLDPEGTWTLTRPTPGADNRPQAQAEPRSLHLNEILAAEDVTLDADFIELYNSASLPVPLAGLALTDSLASLPRRGPLPDLGFVAAQGFVVFRADDSHAPGHLPFRLSSWGEVLALVDSGDKVIDSLLYGPQTTDVSEGRSPDGGPHFAHFDLPTPGVANPTVAEAQVVSLVSFDQTWRYFQEGPAPAGWDQPDFDDGAWPSGPGLLYVEKSSLPGPKNTPLRLGRITYYFRCHVTIPADTSRIVAWRLSTVVDDGAVVSVNGREVLRLRLPDGPLADDTRAARTVSNAEIEGPFDVPAEAFQPGDNVIAVAVHQTSSSSSDIVMGLSLEAVERAPGDDSLAGLAALRAGLRITELMYHAPADRSLDYLELANVGSTPLDLSGVRLAAGVHFTFGPRILAPAERILVVADLSAFTAAYGAALPVAGAYTGNLDNSGERVVLQLPAPYEAAILRFRYTDTWYPETDGSGLSLTVADPQQAPAQWDDPAGWRADDPSPGW